MQQHAREIAYINVNRILRSEHPKAARVIAVQQVHRVTRTPLAEAVQIVEDMLATLTTPVAEAERLAYAEAAAREFEATCAEAQAALARDREVHVRYLLEADAYEEDAEYEWWRRRRATCDHRNPADTQQWCAHCHKLVLLS